MTLHRAVRDRTNNNADLLKVLIALALDVVLANYSVGLSGFV